MYTSVTPAHMQIRISVSTTRPVLLWALRAPRLRGDVDHRYCTCFTASWYTRAVEEGRYVKGSVHREGRVRGPCPFTDISECNGDHAEYLGLVEVLKEVLSTARY